MAYTPFLIANQRTGLELDLEPWLLPPDGYAQLENWYLYQGRLLKRNGYTLFGRLVHHVKDAALGNKNGKSFSGTLAHHPLRPGDLVITDSVETFTDNGDGTLTGSAGGTGTIVYATGAWAVTFNAAPTHNVTGSYDWFPGLPVMGLFNYSTNLGSQQLIAFDTRRACYWNNVNSKWQDIGHADIWSGDDTNFFWMENWQNKAYICNGVDQLQVYNGTTITPWVIDTVNSQIYIAGESVGTGAPPTKTFTGTLAHVLGVSGTFTATDGVETFSDNGDGTLTGSLGGTGSLIYSTGVYSITFKTAPILSAAISANYYYNYTSGGNHVTGCVFIAQYKNRLILYRPTEDSLDMNQRIRWCNVGDPTTWPADNWLDADGSAWLSMGAWISDNLVGFFERGISLLQYLGDPRLPFYWKSIVSNEGLLASMTPQELEDEVFFMGITQIATTDGYQVIYMDKKIPNFVLSVRQSLVRLSYSGMYEPLQQIWLAFPSLAAVGGNDQVMIFSIEDNAWALFDMPLTCFGYYERGADWIWSDFTYPWTQATWKWNDRNLQGGYPILLGGDSAGNVYQLDLGSSDNGANINAEALSARLNPYVKNGLKARLGWLEMLVDTNSDMILNVNLYADNKTTPYASFPVTLDDGRGQAKSWVRVPSGVAGQFHQIGLQHNGLGGGIVVHALLPYFQEGGPLR